MTAFLVRVVASVAFWPTTMFWVIATIVAYLVADGRVTWQQGALVLVVSAVLIILASMYRELATVHTLVNSQHDRLVRRIDQLVAELKRSGVEVPESPNGENND